jgi:hypothetical protein
VEHPVAKRGGKRSPVRVEPNFRGVVGLRTVKGFAVAISHVDVNDDGCNDEQ